MHCPSVFTFWAPSLRNLRFFRHSCTSAICLSLSGDLIPVPPLLDPPLNVQTSESFLRLSLCGWLFKLGQSLPPSQLSLARCRLSLACQLSWPSGSWLDAGSPQCASFFQHAGSQLAASFPWRAGFLLGPAWGFWLYQKWPDAHSHEPSTCS